MSVTKAQLLGGVGLSTVGDLTVYGGVNATGVVTASSFVGPLTGTASTATVAGTAYGLTGTPNITVGFITATGASISGNVNVGGNVSIAGTLTYEDVTNVDSIGIVTARAGIVLGPTANTIQLGTGTTISSPASNAFTILTGGSERVRVDSSGRALFGTSTVPSNKNSVTPTFAISASGVNGAAQITRHTSVGAGGALLELSATRGTSNTDYTILQSGDGIGTVDFSGADGNEFVVAAAIQAAVDGTPGDNDMPGRLVFSTTADGASSPTERCRISNSGGFSVGTIANPGAGAIYATGDITAFYSSDIRLKKDIEPISEPIKKLMEISGVTYKWNEEYLKDKEVDGYFVRETEVGVIAQDVEKVLPEVVATRENGYKAVRYEKLVALLIEAVKDQQHQIDELKARLEEK